MRTTVTTQSAVFAAMLVLVLAAPVSAAPPTRAVYVALGDSLAEGQGASDWDTTGYVALFADYVAGTPHGDAKDLVNLGFGGETTTSFLANGQLQAALDVIAEPSDVRFLTLSVGGNDLLNLLYNDTPCRTDIGSVECTLAVGAGLYTVASNYPSIVSALASALANDPDAEDVYVLTLYNPFKGTGTAYDAAIDFALLGADGVVNCAGNSNLMYVGLNDIVACAAFGVGWKVVDGYALFGDRAMELTHMGEGTFDFHPNDAGYAILADAHIEAQRAGD